MMLTDEFDRRHTQVSTSDGGSKPHHCKMPSYQQAASTAVNGGRKVHGNAEVDLPGTAAAVANDGSTGVRNRAVHLDSETKHTMHGIKSGAYLAMGQVRQTELALEAAIGSDGPYSRQQTAVEA